MARSINVDRTVTDMVRGEHVHGLCIRQGRLARDSGPFVAIMLEASGNCLLDTSGSSSMGEPLTTK